MRSTGPGTAPPDTATRRPPTSAPAISITPQHRTPRTRRAAAPALWVRTPTVGVARHRSPPQAGEVLRGTCDGSEPKPRRTHYSNRCLCCGDKQELSLRLTGASRRNPAAVQRGPNRSALSQAATSCEPSTCQQRIGGCAQTRPSQAITRGTGPRCGGHRRWPVQTLKQGPLRVGRIRSRPRRRR